MAKTQKSTAVHNVRCRMTSPWTWCIGRGNTWMGPLLPMPVASVSVLERTTLQYNKSLDSSTMKSLVPLKTKRFLSRFFCTCPFTVRTLVKSGLSRLSAQMEPQFFGNSLHLTKLPTKTPGSLPMLTWPNPGFSDCLTGQRLFWVCQTDFSGFSVELTKLEFNCSISPLSKRKDVDTSNNWMKLNPWQLKPLGNYQVNGLGFVALT